MIEPIEQAISFLNMVLFHIGPDSVTVAEVLGFVSGGASVWLAMRGHIANFPVGIANSAIFLMLFASARLWSNAALQLVFVTLGFAGWRRWALTKDDGEPVTVVSRASIGALAGCAAFVAIGSLLLTPLLTMADDATPFWDALTTCLSLAAQWLLNSRKIETWWFWIAADCIYVPFYAIQGLSLTAVIYGLFLLMCIGGLRSWQRTIATPVRAGNVEEVSS